MKFNSKQSPVKKWPIPKGFLKITKKAKKALEYYGMRENIYASYSGWKFEFKIQDGWIGYYWQIEKCNSTHDQFDLWICLIPFIPLHLWWLILKRKRGEDVD